MRASTTQFAQVVASNETEPVTQVTVAWPATVVGAPTDLSSCVQSFTFQADLTTDMPVGSRLLAGYPSRGGTLILSGRLTSTSNETNTAEWLFDAWSATSPLWRQDWTGLAGAQFTVKQGLQLVGFNTPELFTIFTGSVDDVVVNRRTGDITLTLIDDRLALTTTPQVPTAIAVTPWAPTLTPNPIFAPGLTALWPLDYILRANGIYSGPPPRPGCIAYASLHGSLWPEVAGSMTASNCQLYGSWPGFGSLQPVVPTWGPGLFSAQVPGAGGVGTQVRFPTTTPVVQKTGTTLLIEGWFLCSYLASPVLTVGLSDTLALSPHTALSVSVDTDSLGNPAPNPVVLTVAGVVHTSATPTQPGSGPGWHKLTLAAAVGAANVVLSLWLDGVSVLSYTFTGLSNLDLTAMGQFNLNVLNAADTWQATLNEASPVPSGLFTPTAVLDASLNNLTAVPPIPKGSDAWAVIQAIVDAEGGVAGFDEDNIFHFRNRSNIATSTSQATVTSLTQIKELQYETNEANRARSITVNAFPLTVGLPTTVWSATQVYVVPAHGRLDIFAALTNPALFVPSGFIHIPTGGLTTFGNNGVRFARAADGSGAAVTGVGVVAGTVTSSSIAISIFNPNGYAVYLVSRHGDGPATSDGAPALSLVGSPIVAAGSVDSTGVAPGAQTVMSSQGTGLPNLTLTDNAWRQDRAATQTYADDLLADLYRPRPVLTSFTIVGDSRLQLGDRVTLQDQGEFINGGFGPGAVLNDDVILTSIHPTRDYSNGFTQTCIARTVYTPGAWIMGVAGRSEMGVNTRL